MTRTEKLGIERSARIQVLLPYFEKSIKRYIENPHIVYIPNAIQAGKEIDLPRTAKVNVYGKTLEIPIEWNKNESAVSDSIQIYEDTQITAVLKFNGRTYRKTYNIKVK